MLAFLDRISKRALQKTTLSVPQLKNRSVTSVADEEFATFDLGLLNLVVARGLPGAETVDLEHCNSVLDEWARTVALATQANYWRFVDDPAFFRHSEALFCSYMLVWTLQESCGVRYNHDLIEKNSHTDSRDLLIHGLIPDRNGDRPGGTCSNLPVLYAAVGRRLGYPLKLVRIAWHCFVRWDDPEGRSGFGPEVFNIEGSGEGFASEPDEYYRFYEGVERATEYDIVNGWDLASLTPRQEMAWFFFEAGMILFENLRIHEAAKVFRVAWDLYEPNTPPPKFIAWRNVSIAMVGSPIPAESDGTHRSIKRECDRMGLRFGYATKKMPASLFFPPPEKIRPFRSEDGTFDESIRLSYERAARRPAMIDVFLYWVPRIHRDPKQAWQRYVAELRRTNWD